MGLCCLLVVPAIIGIGYVVSVVYSCVVDWRRAALVDFLDDFLWQNVKLAKRGVVESEFLMVNRRLQDLEDRDAYNTGRADHISAQMAHQAECILKLDKALKARKR